VRDVPLSASARDDLDLMLARAVAYRALSTGFQTPTAARLRQMGASDRFPAVAAALRCLDPSGTSGALTRAAAELTALPPPDIGELAERYWRLFGHTTRGPICACETEYGPDNGFHQPQQLADISGYYLAFGLRASSAADARADHIACECEFMDFLSRKEALWFGQPPQTAPADTLELTRQAARTFLRDHLGRFGRAFATRVAAEDDGYFGVLGQLLLALVDAECARVGVEAGPIDLLVRPPSLDETPMACGTADGRHAEGELIQIQRRP
jgi:TorA maturation chaperone TorD